MRARGGDASHFFLRDFGIIEIEALDRGSDDVCNEGHHDELLLESVQHRADDIDRIEPTRTSWLEGWGLRWTRHGMLYNAEGFDAVRIVRRDGKALRIGTDDLPRLMSRLQAQLDRRRTPHRR